MSYYLGFRHGWVRVLGVQVCWCDPTYYRRRTGLQIGCWKVWMQ